MPLFRYTGDDERFFPDSSVSAAPGDTVEADDNPDPQRFEPVAADDTAAPPLEADTVTPVTTPEEI